MPIAVANQPNPNPIISTTDILIPASDNNHWTSFTTAATTNITRNTILNIGQFIIAKLNAFWATTAFPVAILKNSITTLAIAMAPAYKKVPIADAIDITFIIPIITPTASNTTPNTFNRGNIKFTTFKTNVSPLTNVLTINAPALPITVNISRVSTANCFIGSLFQIPVIASNNGANPICALDLIIFMVSANVIGILAIFLFTSSAILNIAFFIISAVILPSAAIFLKSTFPTSSLNALAYIGAFSMIDLSSSPCSLPLAKA